MDADLQRHFYYSKLSTNIIDPAPNPTSDYF